MKNMVYSLWAIILLLSFGTVRAGEVISIDKGWQFALGNAADKTKDFGFATEYFTYWAKAASIHNKGPYALEFDAKGWQQVDLPHDWVVDLPFDKNASHSHGYKQIGFNYPANSVGWYRKTFTIPAEDEGKHLQVQFDGIFRDATVWLNGFLLGHENSGYATQLYDISEYVNYGGENLLTVRVDASVEEGWFYEGAGIYRHVWLRKANPVHVATFGTFAHSQISNDASQAVMTVETTVENKGLMPSSYTLLHRLMDRSGAEVARASVEGTSLESKAQGRTVAALTVNQPHLWSTDSPYLYRIETQVLVGGKVVDTYSTKTGIRSIRFDANKGFLLNGKQVKLKGVNMHQDHPGVGAGIPDALQVYRLKQLKSFGCNAYRASHNPMTPAMLDACDSLGILVIDENRLMGVNTLHQRLLQNMIERDRNHPSIILWSVGNEEWGIEWKESGKKIAASMQEFCHRLDPSRPVTVATSGGPTIVVPVDVAGYNYITQNPVDEHRKNYPQRCAIGTEETSGCGTRGVYFDRNDEGLMVALNRKADAKDSVMNRIERGWKFYAEREWLGGLFYWTGFDYRGEPNPMKFPATGSQFGILDYCGFPKDEAYYLRAWWTNEPVLHLLPHWNLKGHEGETIDLWAYSNCDEVELVVNGKRMERKAMPVNGHLSWKVTYQPGKVVAYGYKKGKRVLTTRMETTGEASEVKLSADRKTIQANGADVAVCRVDLQDKKHRFVPDANLPLRITVNGPVRILGVGNGNPAFQDEERPHDRNARTFSVKSFNGLAQILLQSTGEKGTATMKVEGNGLKTGVITLTME